MFHLAQNVPVVAGDVNTQIIQESLDYRFFSLPLSGFVCKTEKTSKFPARPLHEKQNNVLTKTKQAEDHGMKI